MEIASTDPEKGEVLRAPIFSLSLQQTASPELGVPPISRAPIGSFRVDCRCNAAACPE